MASIQKILGYGGTIEKQTAPRGVVAYVVKVTDGPESQPMPTRKAAQSWLEKHAKVISTRYRAQVRVGKRPSESETFPNKKEAEAWAASIETAIREGRHFPHAVAKRTSFDALAKAYLADFDATPQDSETVVGKSDSPRAIHLKWWSKQFAGLTVSEVTSDVIAKARDACAAETFTRGKPHKNKETGETIPPKEYKRSNATVNRYLAALSDAMSYAVKEHSPRLIDRNPVSDIKRKKEPRGRTRFLTDAERGALLDACAASEWSALHALVLLAITTGARRGELISLLWSDVDMKAGRALVRDSKNGEQRTLPLAGKALDALKALEAVRAKKPKAERSENVFPNPSGHPGAFEYFDSHWYAALEAAGIDNFHFHDLRHTTASMLAAQGCSLLEIADVLGHKTLAMVKRYSHLLTEHKAGVIERMIAAKGL
jgi:integrase